MTVSLITTQMGRTNKLISYYEEDRYDWLKMKQHCILLPIKKINKLRNVQTK